MEVENKKLKGCIKKLREDLENVPSDKKCTQMGRGR